MELLLRHPILLVGRILSEAKRPEGNMFVLTATWSPSQTAPSHGQHNPTSERAPLLGTPSPHEGSATALSPLAEQEQCKD